MKGDNELGGLIESKELEECGKEIFENIINAVLGDKVALGKSVKNLAMAPFVVREHLFFNKLRRYFEGVYLDESDKRKISEVFSDQEEKLEYAQEILHIIDSISNDKKITYIINLTRALLADFVEKKDFYRMLNSIKNVLVEDLEFLSENVKCGSFENNVHIDFLLQAGLMYQSSDPSPTTGSPEKYRFTALAIRLDKYALSYNVDGKYSYEEKETELLKETHSRTPSVLFKITDS